MKLKSIIATGALLLGVSLSAGQVDINGRVTDKNGVGIEGVKVSLQNAGYETLTDGDGDYYVVEAVGVKQTGAVKKEQQTFHNNRLNLSLTSDATVKVELFGVNGQRRAVLYNGVVTKGNGRVSLQENGLANGMYLMAITVNGNRSIYRQSLMNGKFSGFGSETTSETYISQASRSRAGELDVLTFTKEGYETHTETIESYSTEIDVTLKKNGSGGDEIEVEKKTRAFFAKVTASWCGPCGTYAPLFEEIAEIQKDDAITLAVYPSSSCDIVTQAGKEMNNTFLPASSYPTFFVNTTETSNYPPTKSEVAQKVSAFTSGAVIAAAGAKVTSDGSQLTIDTRTEFYESVSGNYSVASYIVQKHKDGYQKNYSGGHHFVLEACANNSISGEALGNSFSAGDSFEKSATIAIDNSWHIDQILVYVIIWNGTEYVNGKAFTISDGDTDPELPVITLQPEDQEVEDGESVTFSISASGEGLSYKWYKDDISVGTNSNSYSFTAALADDQSEVYCEVSNSVGTVKSSVAHLTVTSGGGTIPSSFTKKAVIEYGTGTWCQYCPGGAEESHRLENLYEDRLYVVAIHASDRYEVPEAQPMLQKFNCSGYPTGAVNRIASGGKVFLSKNDWSSRTASIMRTSTVDCGLKLESSNSSVTVTAGFSSSKSNVGLVVVLLESGIANSGQSGANNSYLQNHLLREVLTNDLIDGDALSGSAGSETKTYNFSTSGYNSSNCTLVAYIVKKSSSSTGYEILNAQAVELGGSKDFD